MIPDEDLVLHRGTRNPLLPFDHWLRAFDGHTSRRDGLETSFVAMIPLYRRVIETQDICMLTRDRFDDKRTRRRTEYHCYSFYSTSLHIFTRYLLKRVFQKVCSSFFFLNAIIELHFYELHMNLLGNKHIYICEIVHTRQFHKTFSLIIN